MVYFCMTVLVYIFLHFDVSINIKVMQSYICYHYFRESLALKLETNCDQTYLKDNSLQLHCFLLIDNYFQDQTMASYIWWLNQLFMSVGDCFDVQFAVGWYIFIELSISLIKNHPCLNSNSNSILESCVSAFSHHMFLTVSDAIVY